MALGKTTPKKKPASAKRKTATKKAAPKKTAKKQDIRSKTAAAKRKMRQTGKTYVSLDKTREAKKPGKRTSANGKTYYERRANRSDVGKLLGTVERGFCYRTNSDGSTTIYGESMTAGKPCPRGGTTTPPKTQTVSALNAPKRKSTKKPTAKQLAARAKFAANVKAGKYR